MKKLLCFLTSVLFVLSGLYAQNCVNFALPNLTPGPADQTITLTFSNAGLDNSKEYALNYEFYKKTNEESDFHLMTDLEMDNDFNLGACTFLARFRATNYYGEYINHASGYFPNGPFEAGGNMSDHAFNFFTGSYLNLNGGSYQAQLKLNLGWRSGMDYTGLDYMIVVKLVTMKDGELDGLKYGGKYIGGSEAELEGTVVTRDTITTIKYLTEIEQLIHDEIVMTHVHTQEQETKPVYTEETDPETVLIVPDPYSMVYVYWLMTKIDMQNQEDGRYNVDRALFENHYDTMSDWWTRNHMPLQRVREFKV